MGLLPWHIRHRLSIQSATLDQRQVSSWIRLHSAAHERGKCDISIQHSAMRCLTYQLKDHDFRLQAISSQHSAATEAVSYQLSAYVARSAIGRRLRTWLGTLSVTCLKVIRVGE
jgi:hypothetical protein